MTLSDTAIDATLDSIEEDSLAASCARIPPEDDAGSAPPACLEEPDLTPYEVAELQREIAMVVACMRATEIKCTNSLGPWAPL